MTKEELERRLESVEIVLINLNDKIEMLSQTSPQLKQAICLNDASKEYNISKSLLYKLTSTNEVPHSKRGAKIYFERSIFENWLLENKKEHIL